MHLPRFMLELYASCRRSPTGSKNTLWNHLGCMLANIRRGAFEYPVLFLSKVSFCCDLNWDFLPGKKPFLNCHHFAHWGDHPEFLKLFSEVLSTCWLFGLYPGFRWGYSWHQVMWPCTSPLSSLLNELFHSLEVCLGSLSCWKTKWWSN